MTVRRAPAGYVAPLHLAAAVVASNDGPDEATAVCRRYQNELRVLRDVAERNLAHADGDTEFVYGLHSLMAFEDRGVGLLAFAPARPARGPMFSARHRAGIGGPEQLAPVIPEAEAPA
jgi:hypothetical protein